MNSYSLVSSGESFEVFSDKPVDQQMATVTLSFSCRTIPEKSQELTPRLTELQKISIPRDIMDRVAIEWIKKRHLQGEVIGPLAIWLV